MTRAEKPPHDMPEATPLGSDGPLRDVEMDAAAADCRIGGHPHGPCVAGEWADSRGVDGRIVAPDEDRQPGRAHNRPRGG